MNGLSERFAVPWDVYKRSLDFLKSSSIQSSDERIEASQFSMAILERETSEWPVALQLIYNVMVASYSCIVIIKFVIPAEHNAASNIEYICSSVSRHSMGSHSTPAGDIHP